MEWKKPSVIPIPFDEEGKISIRANLFMITTNHYGEIVVSIQKDKIIFVLFYNFSRRLLVTSTPSWTMYFSFN